MAADVAETTRMSARRKDAKKYQSSLSRLLDAHQEALRYCRETGGTALRRAGDDGNDNDGVVSDVLRTNEMQVWFLSEHFGRGTLVKAQPIPRSA